MMPTQCERLLTELQKGRKLTQRQMFDELRIGNHTGRVSDLRKKGYVIKCEDKPTEQGVTGLYSLETAPNSPVEQSLVTVAPNAPEKPVLSGYWCPKAHPWKFYGEGRQWEDCPTHFEKSERLKD